VKGKKPVVFLIVALIVFGVAYRPDIAADTLTGLLGGFRSLIEGAGDVWRSR